VFYFKGACLRLLFTNLNRDARSRLRSKPCVGLDFEKLVNTPKEAVRLPTLERKASGLAGMHWGMLDVVTTFLSEVVAPYRQAGQNLSLLLSGGLMGPKAEAAMHNEEEQANPEHLASRLSRLSQEAGKDSNQQEHLPPDCP
jgi:hypothetical protein